MSSAPISLHVYKGCNGHRIVQAADKSTVLYYLSLARNLVGWSSTLHAHRQSPVLYEMSLKTTMASYASTVLVKSLSDGWTTRLCRDSFPGTNHKFSGRDGRQYCWKWASPFSLGNDLQCVNDQNELVAIYQCCTMALRKDGELIIFPPGLFMIDLLVATGLAMRTNVN